MSLTNNNFEGNISTYMFGKRFWYFRGPEVDCQESLHFLWEKIFNSFRSV